MSGLLCQHPAINCKTEHLSIVNTITCKEDLVSKLQETIKANSTTSSEKKCKVVLRCEVMRKQNHTVKEDDMDGKQLNSSQVPPGASFPFQGYP